MSIIRHCLFLTETHLPCITHNQSSTDRQTRLSPNTHYSPWSETLFIPFVTLANIRQYTIFAKYPIFTLIKIPFLSIWHNSLISTEHDYHHLPNIDHDRKPFSYYLTQKHKFAHSPLSTFTQYSPWSKIVFILLEQISQIWIYTIFNNYPIIAVIMNTCQQNEIK